MPTATVITDVFAAKSRREAELRGEGALPLIVIPHPIGQLPPETVGGIADRALEEVLAALTRPREELAQRYRRVRGGDGARGA